MKHVLAYRTAVSYALVAFVGGMTSAVGILAFSLLVSDPAPPAVHPTQGVSTVQPYFGDSDAGYVDPEYCRNVVLATLASCQVEVDRNTLVIEREPGRRGSAIEQFATLFGELVRTRQCPRGPGMQEDVLTARLGR
ncbi:MAG: hypothetical protein AAFX05_02680 [Planctomycetota bacterium]